MLRQMGAAKLVVWISVLGVSVLGLDGPRPAWGQTVEQKAGARAAADAGAEAFDAGRYQEAIDLFSRAEAIVHAPPHLLNIARAYVKLGRLVSAQDSYLKIVRERLPSGAPEPFKEAWAAADRELGELEPRIPRLTIQVTGAEGSQVQVTMDGQPVPSALLGIPHPVDPGDHTVSANAGGERQVTRSVTVAVGARESVELDVPSARPNEAPSVVSAQRVEAPRREPESRGLAHQPALAYGALAFGAVGLGVGTGFLVSYLQTRDEADSKFAACKPRSCTDDERSRVNDLDRRASQHGTIAWIGMVAGGIGVATGVTLLIVQLSRRADPHGATVYPYVGPQAAGLWGRY